MNYDLLKNALFRLDAETAHRLGVRAIRSGLVRPRAFFDPRLACERFGVRFDNPLGLAAGFDKDAVAIPQWPRLGFGFVEVGTLTLRAQPGNPKPRMFRLPEERALINRLGFNNGGAVDAAGRLPASGGGFPVGVNIGRNKDVDNADAPGAYAAAAAAVRGRGAYLVVNVSSPNTAGLRELQDRTLLGEILDAVRGANPEAPLFAKIAPDLSDDAIDDALRCAVDWNLTGLVATNTTITRPVAHDPDEAGGLSGRPLAPLARRVLRRLAASAPPSLTLIGVGGVMTSDDLYDRLADGAHLIQSYTGFVYGGPGFAASCLRGLAERMEREGLRSVDELVGSGRSSTPI